MKETDADVLRELKLPIDYFVDVATGLDTNNGELGNPVRSITRAVEIASTNETTPGRDSGRIFVSAGLYQPPGELFPIHIPPAFDLIGAGRVSTTIRFTGAVTVSSDAPPVTYWGGTAIVAGRRIQGLTLETTPEPPGYSCSAMRGIDCSINNTVIEDVHVLLPEPFDSDRGFNDGLRMRGINGRINQTRIERMANNRGLLLENSAVTVTNLEMREAHLAAPNQQGSNVSSSFFETFSYARLSGDVRFERNVFRGVWLGAYGSDGSSPAPVIGPGNDILGTGVQATGNAIVEDNDIRGSFTLECLGAGTPVIRGNTIRVREDSLRSHYLLWVGFPSSPLIENNRFNTFKPTTGEVAWFSRQVAPLRVESEADFGGGPQGSTGQNHFGCMVSTPARSKIDVFGGGTVHMSNNYWRNPGNFRITLDIASGTAVTAENPMRDGELCTVLPLPVRPGFDPGLEPITPEPLPEPSEE